VVDEEDCKVQGYNVYRTLLACMSGGYELSFCFKGFKRLLNNVHESNNTYLPGSVSGIECYQEILILLWKFLEDCPHFISHILGPECDVNDLVVPICYILFEARQDPNRIGLVHLCTFILLKLSGERDFGVAVNKPFHQHLPIQLPLFTGSHNDLIVITLHKVITDGIPGLASLYSCYLTTICNISPYFRSLSITASVKLVSLFEHFSTNRMLYGRDRDNTRNYLSLIVESLNNVIQYQWAYNNQLIYAVVRKKVSFDKVLDLKLEEATSVWKRLSAGKKGGKGGATAAGASAKASPSTSPAKEAPAVLTPPPPPPTPPPSPPQAKTGGEEEAELKEVKVGDEAADGDGGDDDDDERKPAASVASSEPVLESPPPIVTTNSRTTARTGAPQWQPTEEWLSAMKTEIPLMTLSRLFLNLMPSIDSLINHSNGVVDEREILAHISSTTMVGLLPVPHPLIIRKYQPNVFTNTWLTSYLWGVIFLRNQRLPIFDGESVKLFRVNVK
jgi:hypothetical protein